MDRFLPLQRVLLAVAVLGGGIWTFLGHTAAALERERADLASQAKRLVEAESSLGDEIARAEQAQTAAAEKQVRLTAIREAIQVIATLPLVPEKPVPAKARPATPPPPKGPRDNTMFAELLDDPDYAQLCTTALRQEVDERYGAILFRFQTDPAKFTGLTQLLIERRLVALEAEGIAARQGLSSLQQPEAIYDARDRLEAEIRMLAGDDLYAQLK